MLIKLDGTHNKRKLGANAILAASMVYAKLSAKVSGIELFDYFRNFATKQYSIVQNKSKTDRFPTIMVNVANGGKHSDSPLNFQEFMIVPSKFKDFKTTIEATSNVFNTLKKNLKSHKRIYIY